MSNVEDRTIEREVLTELAAVLGQSDGPPRRPVLARPPVHHARSTIYFVADAARPSRDPRWVVKRPDDAATQGDLANPLAAAQQFAALKAVATHFDAAPPQLRAVRPVAFLAGVEALAMEFVPGPSLDRLVRPRAVARATPLLDGVRLSGAFLRHLHAIRPPQERQVDLAAVAVDLLRLIDETMRPAGLPVPDELAPALDALPVAAVSVPMVQLHGDFAAVNMILGEGPSVTGIDVSLDQSGPAEADMGRFVMMLITQRLFLAVGDSQAARSLRRRIAATLFDGYAGAPDTTVLFELHLVRQLCLRWLQRHTARLENHPRLGAVRRAPVDRYFRALLRERAQELARDASVHSARDVGRALVLRAAG